MIRATVEFTGPIVAKARWAIFYDTGLVIAMPGISVNTRKRSPRKPGSTKPPIQFDNLASDIGVGVRLDLPIGPLRIDYGIPLQRLGTAAAVSSTSMSGYQF